MSDQKDPDKSNIESPQDERELHGGDTLPAQVGSIDAPTLRVEQEEDEETWTNHPASASDSGTQAHVAEGDFEGDDDEDEEEEADSAPVLRKPIQNGRDVVCEELPARASRAKARLRPYLTGTLVIELTNLGERFLFDWRDEEPKVSPVEGPIQLAQGDPADAAKVDCVVSLTEQNLMSIRSGELNPQLAMLADKVKVKGKVAPAVYLFNLVAPRERQ